MVKRSRLEIIYDILLVINKNGSIKITPLLRRSNISTTRFKGYFSELLKKGFVKEVYFQGEKKFLLAERGVKFLEKYKTIISFIDEFEL